MGDFEYFYDEHIRYPSRENCDIERRRDTKAWTDAEGNHTKVVDMKTGHLINTIRFLKRRAIRDYGEVWEDCVIPVYYTMLHEAEYRNVKYDRPQPINIITMVQDGDDTPREVSRVRISTGGKY